MEGWSAFDIMEMETDGFLQDIEVAAALVVLPLLAGWSASLPTSFMRWASPPTGWASIARGDVAQPVSTISCTRLLSCVKAGEVDCFLEAHLQGVRDALAVPADRVGLARSVAVAGFVGHGCRA